MFVVAFPTACRNESSGQRVRQDNSATKQPAGEEKIPDDGLRRITVEELRAALAENRAVVIDVRGSVEYDLSHIKGALLLPLGQIAARAKE